jgi:flagellar basal body-associated protein FliL
MPYNDTSESLGKRTNRIKIFVVLLVVIILGLGGGVGGWMWYTAKKKKDAEATENEIETRLKSQLEQKNIKRPLHTVLLDPFIVRLQTKDGHRQSRVEISLSTFDSTIEQKLGKSLLVVRERIFSHLVNYSSEQFSSSEQKVLIGREIAVLVNSIIEPQLTSIYILQKQPSAAELKILERTGALPKDGQMSQVAREAAAQFWRISEMDLPITGVFIKAIFVD